MNTVLHLDAKPGQLGAYAFLVGDPGRVERLAQHLDNPSPVATHRGYVIHSGFLSGTRVSVIASGIGCPSTAIAVEELVALGVRTFLRVGTCGSLQNDVHVGDLVVSTAAVRDEGTTRQYIPVEFPAVASVDLVRSLTTACRAQGMAYHVGITHCKDAFYSEIVEYTPNPSATVERWEYWRSAGVLATEMEAAAIYVLSSLRRCRAGAILGVVGSLDLPGLFSPQAGAVIDPLIRAATGAMSDLIRLDVTGQ